MRFTVQRKRLTEGLRPNHGICLHSHLISSLLKPSYSSAFNPGHHVCISRKTYKTHQKAKEKRKIFLKRKASSEPDMAGMLEISEEEFKSN